MKSQASALSKPVGCTNFKLRQLSRLITQSYDLAMSAAGIKITQYSLLSVVLKLGPIRPVDLAAQMTMDTSTVSRNLKPLLEAGWLKLRKGEDARSHRIEITESGRAKRQEASKLWRAAQESLNQTLGVERVNALHLLIDDALALLEPENT